MLQLNLCPDHIRVEAQGNEGEPVHQGETGSCQQQVGLGHLGVALQGLGGIFHDCVSPALRTDWTNSISKGEGVRVVVGQKSPVGMVINKDKRFFGFSVSEDDYKFTIGTKVIT